MYVWLSACLHACAPYTCLCPQGLEEDTDPQELVLQKIISSHVSADKQTQVLYMQGQCP